MLFGAGTLCGARQEPAIQMRVGFQSNVCPIKDLIFISSTYESTGIGYTVYDVPSSASEHDCPDLAKLTDVPNRAWIAYCSESPCVSCTSLQADPGLTMPGCSLMFE